MKVLYRILFLLICCLLPLHGEVSITPPRLSDGVKKNMKDGDTQAEKKIIAVLDSAMKYSDAAPAKALYFLQSVEYEINFSHNKTKVQALYLFTGGLVYFYLSEFSESLNLFYSCLDLCKSLNDKDKVSLAFNAIGNVFYYTDNMEEALKYYHEALKMNKKNSYKKGIITNLGNIAAVYTHTKKYYEAENTLKEAIHMCNEYENEYFTIANLYGNLSVLYREQKKYEQALNRDKVALAYVDQKEDAKALMLFIINNITEDFILLNRLDSASKYLKISKQMLEEIKPHDLSMQCYKNAILLYAHLGLHDSVEKYHDFYFKVQKQLNTEEKQRQMAESKVKYETDQTAKDNALSKLEIEKQKNLIYGFIIIVIAVLIVLGYIYLRYLNKNKKSKELEYKVEERTAYLKSEIAERIKIEKDLNKAQETALKLEKEILTATISTEERERKRFAEELHDGLGALLSTTKMYTNLIQKKTTESQVDSADLDGYWNTLTELLNDAIVMTKEVANNLIPSVLSDYGLIDTLSAYIQKLNDTDSINIVFDVEEHIIRFDTQIEFATYRIITELLNNTVKHAFASKVYIYVKEDKDFIYMSYKDNGIGFDLDSTILLKTMGLKNIISHTKSISGIYNIVSQKNQGFLFQMKVIKSINISNENTSSNRCG